MTAVLSIAPLLVVVAVVHRGVWHETRDCLPIQGDWAPDRAVAAALRASSPAGRLVTTYGWGQYAIWHFGPSLRVSFDGRRETVYSDATEMRQADIERGNPDGLRFLDQARPEYVWLPTSGGSTRAWLRRQPDYRTDLETPESFLAVRRDLPVVKSVRDVPTACFPG